MSTGFAKKAPLPACRRKKTLVLGVLAQKNIGFPRQFCAVYAICPAAMRAASRVFSISMARVIRPTPPGTGLMAPASG